MEITNSIKTQNILNKETPQVTGNTFKSGGEIQASAANLPSIYSAGSSVINSNLPIAYSKIGEIKIPGLKDKACVFKLANGQKVIIAPKQGPTMVKTAYNVGSMNETDDIRGISHFIEHNLFNGSKDLAPRQYDKYVSALGGSTNANTSYAVTNYFLILQLLNQNSLEEAIRLNSQQTQFPTFPANQLEKEKEPVKSEIDMYKDMPFDVTHSQVLKDLFGISTASTDFIIGTKDNINSMTREKVMDYYNTWYTPDNAVTVITGDVDVNETMALVSKYYNKPNDYTHINKRHCEPINYIQSPKRTDIIMPNAASPHITIGFAIPEGTSKADLEKLNTLISLLSSSSSRLSKALDKTGSSFIFEEEKMQNKPDGAKAKTLEIDTTEENVEKVLQIIYDELSYIANNPPSYDELENIKRQRINNINSIGESSAALNDILSDMALENNYNYWNTATSNIQSITPQDICETAKKFLNLNRTAICVAHDKTSTAETIRHNFNNNTMPEQNVSFGSSFNSYKTIEEQRSKVQQYRLNNNIETTIVPGNAYAKSILNIDFTSDDLNSVPQCSLAVLTRLLNRGSAIRNNDTYNSIKTEKDIALGFASGLDGISVSSIYNDENMQDTISLIKETLANPNFSQEEFEQAKKYVRDMIMSEQVSADDKLFAELFPSVRSCASKEQRLKELDALTLGDIQNLYSYIMSTAKVHASLTADVEQKPYLKDVLHNELSTGLGTYKPYTTEKSTSYHIYKPNTEAKILTRADERIQAEVVQAYTYKKTENIDDIAKILALNSILGGSMSSRLFKDLRETEKLAYHVSSSIMSIKDTGVMLLNIGTTTDSPDPKEGSPANITKSLEGFDRNVNLLKTENITDEELEQIKVQLKTSILNEIETNSGKIFCFGGNKDTVYDTKYYEELYKAIDRLTADDIKAAANYVFQNPPVTSVAASQKTLDYLNLH